MMKNISKYSVLTILALSTLAIAGNASAALFDTMESVDTLQKIADTKRVNKDRMPAGKETAPATDTSKTEESTETKTTN